tara:strand:+ start:217 stop:957 length:741 start_codon:yes stop_codon:yes gene_type:complete
MLKKRIIITLTFLDGVLFRTKKFVPDYRYTKNFIDFWSIDEIILIDISKKKFSQDFINLIKYFSNNCFVPLSVGGGIKKISDADKYFKNGADKIVLGSVSSQNTKIISEISEKYGSQSIIQCIDIKKDKDSKYKLAVESGRRLTEVNPIQSINKSLKVGAGEILINNVDRDGSLLGYDIDIIKKITKDFNCQFLALGGAGNWDHILNLFKKTQVYGACTQNIFHFTEDSIVSAKKFLQYNKIDIRN